MSDKDLILIYEALLALDKDELWEIKQRSAIVFRLKELKESQGD